MSTPDFEAPRITQEYLEALSCDQLVELLMQKTEALLFTSTTKVIDHDLVESLRGDIQLIHATIKGRAAS